MSELARALVLSHFHSIPARGCHQRQRWDRNLGQEQTYKLSMALLEVSTINDTLTRKVFS